MATIKTTIKKNERRNDGTWNVLLRITHNRKSYYLRTSIFVEKKDLTASYKIKNAKILDKCRALENELRDKITELNLEFSDLDITQIVEYLDKSKDKQNIDFINFCKKWLEQNKELKGLKNYKAAINALCSFFGRNMIYCNEITSKSLKDFEEYLSDKKRGQSLYTTSIVRLFNEARYYYNDEDNNIIRIKHTLSRFRPQKQNISVKRSIAETLIKKIFLLPYNNVKVKGYSSRHDLAKDCFILSLCLMGINSVDLFNANNFDGEYIIYNRTKTTERRKHDKALIKVKVNEEIKPLFNKYYDGEKRVFDFYKRFKNPESFNRAINIGLKEIAKEIGVDTLQFYSARHSFATIAVNKCHISKYIVNDMLCHIDSNLRVTELYIDKDFSEINKANEIFINYIMNGSVQNIV